MRPCTPMLVGLAALCLAACQPSPPATTPEAPRPRTLDVSAPPVDATTVPTRAAEPIADSAPAVARRADPLPAPVERVAALSPTRAMAIAGGALYRLQGARWARVGLENATPRDVVAARGALWVLARGEGPFAGRALVLRSAADDELPAVAAPELGAGTDPRALIVVREGEYYVGGDAPSLARIVGRDVTLVDLPDPHVTALRFVKDDVVLALHMAHRVTAWRYGMTSSVDEEDFLDEVTDGEGVGYLVHGRGEFVRGRPGHEVVAITTAAPFPPRCATMLPGVRPAVAGDGAFAFWQGNEWHEVRGAIPADPVAVLPTQPPMIVGRRGAVVAVEGTAVREIVPAGG